MESTDLKRLSDALLQERLAGLVKAEKCLTAEIIEYIKEVDLRRLYLKLGFASLFQYLTESLGYTPASAQRRIDSARLMKEMPELKQEIQSGSLNLMQVSTLARHVREKQKTGRVSVSQKREILDLIKHQDLKISEKTICEKLDVAPKTMEKQHVQRDESIRLEITLNKEQTALLEEVRSFSSHVTAGKNLSEIIEFVAVQYLKTKKPKAKATANNETSSSKIEIKTEEKVTSRMEMDQGALTSKMEVKTGESAIYKVEMNRQAFASKAAVDGQEFTSKLGVVKRRESVEGKRLPAKIATSRYIPVAIRRSLFESQKCCQWRDPKTGRLCGSKFQLQIDHLQPVWAGGGNDPQNLRLLCGVHNRLKYRTEVGLAM